MQFLVTLLGKFVFLIHDRLLDGFAKDLGDSPHGGPAAFSEPATTPVNGPAEQFMDSLAPFPSEEPPFFFSGEKFDANNRNPGPVEDDFATKFFNQEEPRFEG